MRASGCTGGGDVLWSGRDAAGGSLIALEQVHALQSTQLQRVDLIGTGFPPLVLREPVPALSNTEIGRRFIAWQEQVARLDLVVRAQGVGAPSFFVMPDDTDGGFGKIDPVTWGDSIAFGWVDTATGLSDFILRDWLADTTECSRFACRDWAACRFSVTG